MDDYPFDLGPLSRPVSTKSEAAQRWFDRGLMWCLGFNHEEAITCFEAALEADPNLAIAHWGIAYALGPNYNKSWSLFDRRDLAQTVERGAQEIAKAKAKLEHAAEWEAALIATIEPRYPKQTDSRIEDFAPFDDAYADAMKAVLARFPDDPYIQTFTAEALMCRTPWLLWSLKTGEPAEDASTTEARDILERGIAAMDTKGDPTHPGLLHLYIHLMEMSPHPEKALSAATRLRGLVPDAGHLQHMGTHIEVLVGNYPEVVYWNQEATRANDLYRQHRGGMNFYTLYRVHDLHFTIYGGMLQGHFAHAMAAADKMAQNIPQSLLEITSPPMANWAEAYLTARLHVLVRFGKWQEILDEPHHDDRALYASCTTVLHYCKGLAHAVLGDIAAARAEQSAFREACEAVPEKRYLFNNQCWELHKIAEEMLAGEIAYREGDFAQAFKHLRDAVKLDDALEFCEPWGWMQPTRHALAALLLEQGEVAEAEANYRADLGFDTTLARPLQHPENVWALHGFHECLTAQGKSSQAALIKPRLDLALARADTPISASCLCRGHEIRKTA